MTLPNTDNTHKARKTVHYVRSKSTRNGLSVTPSQNAPEESKRFGHRNCTNAAPSEGIALSRAEYSWHPRQNL